MYLKVQFYFIKSIYNCHDWELVCAISDFDYLGANHVVGGVVFNGHALMKNHETRIIFYSVNTSLHSFCELSTAFIVSFGCVTDN